MAGTLTDLVQGCLADLDRVGRQVDDDRQSAPALGSGSVAEAGSWRIPGAARPHETTDVAGHRDRPRTRRTHGQRGDDAAHLRAAQRR